MPKIQTDLDGYMTSVEAAEKWGVSRVTAWTYCDRDLVPCRKVGTQYLVPINAKCPKLPRGRPRKKAKIHSDPLIVAARQARSRAHAKYSGFLVGAALQAASGEVFAGCNVENVSYGLAMCAERAAVFAAVAGGQRRFSALAVVADGGVTPCGACLQVLAEFCDDLPISLVDSAQGDHVEEVRLRELLPRAFHFET